MRSTITALLAACAAAVPVLPGAGVQAQEQVPWTYSGELGASVFFGASRQTAILIRNRAERDTEHLEFAAGAAFDYGEAQDTDGARFVNKRSWSADLSADYLPGGRLSPFIFTTAEGSYERQIDLRVSGGAGGKYRFVDTDRARLDASIAMLLERTSPRPDPTDPALADPETTTIGRWSARLRARRALGDAAQFQLITFFRPKLDELADHTWDVDASLHYAVTEALGVRLSLVNRYDSLAEERGARSNNDGRLFFSVLASLPRP